MEPKFNVVQNKESKEIDRQHIKFSSSSLKENLADNVLSRADENANSSSDVWKDCSIKTVFPFSKGDVSTSYNSSNYSEKVDEKRKPEISDARAYIKEQVDEVGRAFYLGKLQGSSEQNNIGSVSFPLALEKQKEEYPRLPPVKIKSEDKPLTINWSEKFESDGLAAKLASADSNLLIGSYLDVPIGQEIKNAGKLLYIVHHIINFTKLYGYSFKCHCSCFTFVVSNDLLVCHDDSFVCSVQFPSFWA
jgi:hypothetical protein